LGNPSLSAANRQYLAKYPRGWSQRFRVTDDALFYQPIWINNAYFQSLYSDKVNPTNLRQSFEWLLLQMLPDGAPIGYNLPSTPPMVNTLFFGANLLNDERYVWLAGVSADYLLNHAGYLYAQPGLEKPVALLGKSPKQGSCLIFGNSGLPNQMGPLAPDKIVFRDGWSSDSMYLLLNLRFSGWQRYKATNAISLIYQTGPLVTDQLTVSENPFLPRGRSIARDKRIPRESLNGLIVERSGLDAVLFSLTGIGGPWAQDPPYYATVDSFQPGDQLDTANVSIKNWHGWDHTRTIYFFHKGPLVIIDSAKGPPDRKAAFVWHTTGGVPSQNTRLQLRNGEYPAEMLLFPQASNSKPAGLESHLDDRGGVVVKYQPTPKGSLLLLTIFLTRDWVGAEANIISSNGQSMLQITNGGKTIKIPIGNQ